MPFTTTTLLLIRTCTFGALTATNPSFSISTTTVSTGFVSFAAAPDTAIAERDVLLATVAAACVSLLVVFAGGGHTSASVAKPGNAGGTILVAVTAGTPESGKGLYV
ncbi:hypothetical protein D3C87_1587470 [compost metagenome]